MRATLRVLAALLVATVAPSARAGVEDVIGLGPRAIALGGSYAARPHDFAAAYYNPAGLAPPRPGDATGLELSLSAVYAHPALYVTRTGGGRIETPETLDTAAAVLGARFGLGEPFGIQGLSAGMSLVVPRHLFRWSIVPDDDVSWAMLTDRTQILQTHLGLSWRVTQWLAVGASLRLAFDVDARIHGSVTSVESGTDPETGKGVVRAHTRLGTDATVYGRATPLFGVLVTPAPDLHVGLVYRHPSQVDDWGETRVTGVPGLGNIGYTHHFSHYYQPMEIVSAVSFAPASGTRVSLDLTWARWSAAQSTNRNELGEGRWGDTLVPAVGASHDVSPALRALVGYRFVRSPLDNLGGPTNLLDNDRHVVSAGAEVDLGRLLGTSSIDARVTLAAFEMLLVRRTETKDFRRFATDADLARNPGAPGYAHGGHMPGGSLGVEARW